MASMVLNVNGNNRELSETVDKGYVNAKVFNDTIDHSRKFLKTIREYQRHPDLSYNLYVYDAQEINGFSAKRDEEYLIGISTGALFRLYSWFELWTKSKDVRALFGIDGDRADVFLTHVFQTAINFLAAHEYYHILNGHCDLPENEEHFINERLKILTTKERSLFLQCLEYDADSCATAACTNQLIWHAMCDNAIEGFLIQLSQDQECGSQDSEEKENLCLHKATESELVHEMQIFYFAVYSVFKLFSEDEKMSFDDLMTRDPYMYDHPYPGIRMYYVGAVLATNLNRVFTVQKSEEYLNKALEWIFYFERKILGTSQNNDLYFAFSHTSSGAELIHEIHNAWKFVRPQLEKYAYHTLAPFENVDISSMGVE